MQRSAFLLSLGATVVLASLSVATAADHLVFEGKEGPGKGKHIVLLSGDEEDRSEEALPMLGQLLAEKHGFTATVLFSVGADGTVDPNNQGSLTHSEALEKADAIVMALRFRKWDEKALERFDAAVKRGVPVIGLRTSTHAFNIPGNGPFVKLSWGNKGGFGKQVLGETWVSHWGSHKHEATKGVIEDSAKDNPVLRGVTDVFGDTDVYEAAPPADATILLRGQVLKGMAPTDPPADYKKKTAAGNEQGVNEPMMPVAWLRTVKNDAGTENKILCTTMGSATDLKSEGLRRLVVNGVYWGLGLDVPAKADVTIPADWKPTDYGFNGFKKGMKPADFIPGAGK